MTDIPLLECAITCCLLVVSHSRCRTIRIRHRGPPRVPIGPPPYCRVDAVRVQKSPHFLLDVPHVLPAERHPGHKAEEAVQALEVLSRRAKGELR